MSVKALLLNDNWQFNCIKSPNNFDETVLFDTPVPCDVHRILCSAGVIDEPFWSDNFKNCRWVSHSDWLFHRSFELAPSSAGKKIELVFDGIDTYSTVRLNGKILGDTCNMFLQYRFDITNVVRFDCPNELEVELHSVCNTIEQRDVSDYFACFNTHRVFSRRCQCQFGWDWAPDLPSVGIHQTVRIELFDGGFIKDVYSSGDCSGRALFEITLDSISAGRDDTSIDIELSGYGQTISRTIDSCGIRNFLNMEIDSPRLWWPNGYGSANLYDYKIVLRSGKNIIDTRTGRLGFRTVELIQEPLSADKRSFGFRINGKPIFSMGANWVPCDCFIGSIKDETYEHLLGLAKAANFNTIRIWGGGIYENDIFYDLCDQFGLLVWQDIMFACGDIPDDDDAFVRQVIAELKYQVKRLRNHPCIFHWCGGNEKTGAFGKFVTRGELITKFIARGIIADYIPQASYSPSSPFSYNDTANDSRSGDSHGGTYEQAFADDITKFRKHIDDKRAVFMSEFGLHGPPAISSLKEFIPAQSLWPLNGIWESHVQDNPYNSIPQTFVQLQRCCAERLFYKPENIGDFVKTAGTFYAEYLYAEFQHHRRRQPENSGALIWMLNDCWPAANWSLIDYYGRPKQAYYALKRAAKPLMLSFRQTDSCFELYLTNNSGVTASGSLNVYLQNVSGSINYNLASASVELASAASRVFVKIDTADKRLYTANSYLLAVFDNGTEIFQEIYFHNLWKGISWPQPAIELSCFNSSYNSGSYITTFKLTSENFARCVNLSFANDLQAVISDNYFDIPAGSSKDISIVLPCKISADDIILHHWLTDWQDENNKMERVAGLENV